MMSVKRLALVKENLRICVVVAIVVLVSCEATLIALVQNYTLKTCARASILHH